MTTLADEIRAESQRRRATTCAFKVFCDALPPADRKEFLDVLFDGTNSIGAIHTVLEKRGIALGETILKRHRRRECRLCAVDPKGAHGKAK